MLFAYVSTFVCCLFFYFFFLFDLIRSASHPLCDPSQSATSSLKKYMKLMAALYTLLDILHKCRMIKINIDDMLIILVTFVYATFALILVQTFKVIKKLW